MKPEGSNVSYRDLAERFYALDTEVYKASGSELGIDMIGGQVKEK